MYLSVDAMVAYNGYYTMYLLDCFMFALPFFLCAPKSTLLYFTLLYLEIDGGVTVSYKFCASGDSALQLQLLIIATAPSCSFSCISARLPQCSLHVESIDESQIQLIIETAQ